MPHIPPAVRRWMYGLAVAALPLLVYFDLVAIEAAPLWLAFVVAFLNVSDDDSTNSPQGRILGKA